MRTSTDFKSFTVSFTGPVISDTENDDTETTACRLRVVIEIECRLLHWAAPAKGLTWWCTHDDDDRMDNILVVSKKRVCCVLLSSRVKNKSKKGTFFLRAVCFLSSFLLFRSLLCKKKLGEKSLFLFKKAF